VSGVFVGAAEALVYCCVRRGHVQRQRPRPGRVQVTGYHGTGVVRVTDEAGDRSREQQLHVRRSSGRHYKGETANDRGRTELEGFDRDRRVGVPGHENQTTHTGERSRYRRARRTANNQAREKGHATAAVQVHRRIRRRVEKRSDGIS